MRVMFARDHKGSSISGSVVVSGLVGGDRLVSVSDLETLLPGFKGKEGTKERMAFDWICKASETPGWRIILG